MNRRRADPRKTSHHIAAAKPEVKKLIRELERGWDRFTIGERKSRIEDLKVKQGCSVRGLADALHKPESTIRQYAPKSKRGKAVPQAADPLPSVERPSEKIGPKTIPKAASKPVVLPPSSAAQHVPNAMEDNGNAEELTNIARVVFHVLMTRCGGRNAPRAYLRSVLEHAAEQLGSQSLAPVSVRLPEGATKELIIEATRPPLTPTSDSYSSTYQGEWVANVVAIMASSRAVWKRAMQEICELAHNRCLIDAGPVEISHSKIAQLHKDGHHNAQISLPT